MCPCQTTLLQLGEFAVKARDSPEDTALTASRERLLAQFRQVRGGRWNSGPAGSRSWTWSIRGWWCCATLRSAARDGAGATEALTSAGPRTWVRDPADCFRSGRARPQTPEAQPSRVNRGVQAWSHPWSTMRPRSWDRLGQQRLASARPDRLQLDR